MKNRSERTSPAALVKPRARTMRSALILLCLVVLAAAGVYRHKAATARQDAGRPTAAPSAANSQAAATETREAEAQSAATQAHGPAAQAGGSNAHAAKAVAAQAHDRQNQRAAGVRNRQHMARLQEAKEAALKLMLKPSPLASLQAKSNESPRPPARTKKEAAQPADEMKPTPAAESSGEVRVDMAAAEREADEREEAEAAAWKANPQAARLPIPSKALPSSGGSAKAGSQELTASGAVQGQATPPDAPVVEPGRPQVTLMQGKSVVFDVRDLPQTKPEKKERPEREAPPITPRPFEPSLDTSPGVSKQAAAAQATATAPSAPAPAPTLNFDGLDFANWGAGHPPDTNGDVGPAYFIQTINTSIGIYRKSDQARVAAFTFDTFMSQGNFGNLCDTDNFGDPVVLYDSFEDRWVITDFAFQLDASNNVINPPGAFQCFAVSKTGDPVSGGWNFYSINTTGGLGDYPKLGIWPDGLYMSVNMFDYAASGSYQNPRVYAFNKAQMYAGAPSVQVVSFNAPSAEFTLLPANARLQTGTPPAGSPNYFSVVAQFLNTISFYKFHVDWDRISTSTFTGPFNSTMPFWWAQLASANQTAPTPANRNDELYPRLMVQNQYTNIGGVESLWNSHTVGIGNPTSNTTATQSGVRYYQVRVTGGTVEANALQSFTYSPSGDTLWKYMPSVALDRAGNMALGYTTSNATTNPAIKYAGRLAGDAVNSITQDEQTLIQGTGSQSGSCGGTCIRWGDYSTMTLDPNGCTFWMTAQYYATNGLNHLTRIGTFKYPSCTPVGSGGTVSGTVTATVGGAPLSGVTIAFGSRTATTNGSGVYSFSSIPAGTYPSVTATLAGYTTGTATPVVVTDGGTTTKNFSLATAPTSACPADTTQSDFQTGVASNTDLTASPGNVVLSNPTFVDQQNNSVNPTGFGITDTSWAGQTFTPAVTGTLKRVDLELFCASCTANSPNITVSIRATTGATPVPTGADLATATIAGFNDGGGGGFKTADFSSSSLTLTAGTRYAVIIRNSAAFASGTVAYTCSCQTTGFVNFNPYASGQRVTSANSGSTWAADTTSGGRDLKFNVYMNTGFALAGDLTSGTKDGNPISGFETKWSTLSWTATTPGGTVVKFQAAASTNANGPFNFVGPDGTAATYFTTSGASLSQFDSKRYLKYKSYLTTGSGTVTPTLQDVTVCFSNQQIPTAIKLDSFTATPTKDGRVLLQWRTGTEVNNLGFNLYREVDGVRSRITPQIVAGSALMAGANIEMTSGNAYAWADAPPAGQTIRYYLEDIDINGKHTFNGPYSLSSGKADTQAKQAMMLNQLSNRQAELSYTGGTSAVEPSAQIQTSAALPSVQPFALAGLPAVKLSVNHEGWYRVSQPDLVAAGLDPNVNPRNLQLFVDGHEVPMAVQGGLPGKFDSTSSIGFYGLGLDAASSDAHVYWLAAGAQPGQRIEKVQAKGEVTGAASFAYTVERKDRSIYFAALRNGDAENFFGAVITSAPVDQPLSLQRVNKATTANAQLEVALQGVTEQPHRVTVYLNGTQVGAVNFSGQARGLISLPVPHSLLNEGENVVRLAAQGAETDVSLVDSIRITYQHTFKAENNALRLTASAASQVTVDGFTSGDVRIFDVTNPDQPQELTAVVQGQKTGYAVTAGVAGSGQRALLAMTSMRAQQPLAIKANKPSSLRQPSNGANLVVITHSNFAASTASLVALRQKQGLNVTVVDVEDVYDEFSFGNKTPQAIKEFLAYARSNWKQAPQYALLVGAASFDPRNYLGFGDSDFVPTRLIDTVNMQTASDDWLSDFNGNGAEMAIGRLPVRTAQDATAMINKIVSYDAAPPKQSVLLVADRNDSFDFTSTDAALRELIPAGVAVEEVNRNVQDDAAARSQMFAAISSGQKIVNYVGHGSVNSWRGEILTDADAAAMTNTSLPLFITMTCLNGYYHDPSTQGLAEALMKASRGGAVAVWASSGMTVASSQSVLNQQMYRLVFDNTLRLTLGEATQRAKALVDDQDVRRTWILFGDPTMRLK